MVYTNVLHVLTVVALHLLNEQDIYQHLSHILNYTVISLGPKFIPWCPDGGNQQGR